MPREWLDLLFELYKTNRDHPNWAALYELHDEQDRNYFMSLDELYNK